MSKLLCLWYNYLLVPNLHFIQGWRHATHYLLVQQVGIFSIFSIFSMLIDNQFLISFETFGISIFPLFNTKEQFLHLLLSLFPFYLFYDFVILLYFFITKPFCNWNKNIKKFSDLVVTVFPEILNIQSNFSIAKEEKNYYKLFASWFVPHKYHIQQIVWETSKFWVRFSFDCW